MYRDEEKIKRSKIYIMHSFELLSEKKFQRNVKKDR